MADLLALYDDLPEVPLDPGDVLLTEGEANRSIWVLVSGALEVRKSGQVVSAITNQGALIGEISVLLGVPPTATVVAAEPTVLRHAADGEALLSSHSEITKHVAMGLARRLEVATTYLADLKQQYGVAPGIAMVSDALSDLMGRQGPPARPGSARDPDPEY